MPTYVRNLDAKQLLRGAAVIAASPWAINDYSTHERNDGTVGRANMWTVLYWWSARVQGRQTIAAIHALAEESPNSTEQDAG